MCVLPNQRRITPEERREAFDEIIAILENNDRQNSFSETCRMFNDVFEQVVAARNWEYSQEAGQQAKCIFFFPFSGESAHWGQSIEILKTTSHYVIFDRYGRFSIFRRDGAIFGNLILTNSPDDPIAKLEGQSAVDLLSNFAQLSEQISELRKRNLRLNKQIDELTQSKLRNIFENLRKKLSKFKQKKRKPE